MCLHRLHGRDAGPANGSGGTRQRPFYPLWAPGLTPQKGVCFSYRHASIISIEGDSYRRVAQENRAERKAKKG